MDPAGAHTNFDLRLAAALRAMRPFGAIVAFLVFATVLLGPPLTALLVFVWVWLSRTPLSDIGFIRPKSWLAMLAVGVLSGIALKLAMKGVVLPYLGAPATAPILQELRGNFTGFLAQVPQMIILAGFAEEIVFRGFLINRLRTLMGSSFTSSALIVLITAGIFGPAHYVTQGYFGMVQGTIVGVIFATAYVLNGQRLWSLIIAHATFDVLAIWLIYAGLEERVARAVFP
jgi:membrane protease YdiL (CAAX protease family)